MAMAANIECKQGAGIFAPIINRNRCEGKEDCVEVCPYDVFEMRKLSPEIRTRCHSYRASKRCCTATGKPSQCAPRNVVRVGYASMPAPSTRSGCNASIEEADKTTKMRAAAAPLGIEIIS